MTTKSKQLHLVTSVLQVFYYSRASTNDHLSTTATSLQRPLGCGHGRWTIVESISKKVLKRTQKAALSGTLNIALTFGVANWDIIDCIFNFHVCSFEFSCLHDEIWKKRLSRVLKNDPHWENKTFKVKRCFPRGWTWLCGLRIDGSSN